MTGKRCLRCSHCFYFELKSQVDPETEDVESSVTCIAGNDEYVDWGKEPCDKFMLDPIF